ncbi:MAG TPA: hypothetical protein VFC19_49270 [Candidatus Limnocylindrales bacterium]|nr:hypothetical protein [Candidatus Limnocylindrales bacterium]
MATRTLWELMQAVETRAETVGLRSDSEASGSIMPPWLLVTVPPVPSYRAAFQRGTVQITGWPLYVFTSAQVDRVGRKALAEYLSWTGPKSLVLALENEPTLGGVVDDLLVESSRPLGQDEVAGINHFGGVIMLTVQLPGT